MNADFQSKLDKLRADYAQLRGQPFAHFFCPILFKDKDVPLCEAHIVNLAFPDSSLEWTVQRKDVDNFYGSVFESEFITVQYYDDRNLSNAITDKKLSRLLKPRFLVDNKPVEHYVGDDDIPKGFTRAEFDNEGQSTPLVLKMSPEDVLAATGKSWEISISRDVRVPALVSLIKAAHLTLFEMLGYHYALSTGGYFVGRHILGEFFLQNRQNPKSEALKNALPFFREFVHMVRPVQSAGIDLQGTVTDNLLLLCRENDSPPWAFIVFVKTSKSLHAVMIPMFDRPDTVARFLRFLQNERDSIEVALTHFDKDHWKVNRESSNLPWPKEGVLYPE